jgi:hypothetical protein
MPLTSGYDAKHMRMNWDSLGISVTLRAPPSSERDSR